MELYIANTTKQNCMFTYRLQERQQVFARQIRPGGQIVINDLGKSDIDVILKQHKTYGMQSAEEASRRKGFVGLVYSIKGEINVDQMLSTFETNDDSLEKDAQKRREVTAAAISNQIGVEIGKATGANAAPPIRLEVETVEDTQGSPAVASGVEVISNPDKVKPRDRRK